MEPTPPSRPSPARIIVVILGVLLYVAGGLFFFAAGLVIPGFALFLLWALWIVGLVLTFFLARRWSWWTFAAGPASIVFLVAYAWVGSELFDWSP